MVEPGWYRHDSGTFHLRIVALRQSAKYPHLAEMWCQERGRGNKWWKTFGPLVWLKHPYNPTDREKLSYAKQLIREATHA